jgi:2-hydroxy-3-keto-5-methylthiopentenyl-1-phosphate phosphatase
MTRRDFYQLVEERLSPQEASDWWSGYQAGRISHFEALRQIFGAFPAGEAELVRLVHAMDLDPDLAASVTALREAGWEVVVASAGCEWYIRLLLNEAGVDLPVHANPGHVEGGRLVMEWPNASPFQSPRTGIDKVAVVRAAQQGGRTVAFAGDGPPDLEPALLVPAPFGSPAAIWPKRSARRGRSSSRLNAGPASPASCARMPHPAERPEAVGFRLSATRFLTWNWVTTPIFQSAYAPVFLDSDKAMFITGPTRGCGDHSG